MRTTYSRVMTGSRNTGPPIKKRTVYLIVVFLIAATAVFARSEAVDLAGQPTGIAALIAVALGFAVKRSMALTPWALICLALVMYGVDHLVDGWSEALGVGQLVVLFVAVLIGIFQTKVSFDMGWEAARPARSRWGSVLVCGITCLVLVIVSRPDRTVIEWARDFRNPPARESVERGPYGKIGRVGRIEDRAIQESSGLVAAADDPRAFWTHNDSGAPRLFCLMDDGASCGSWSVTGAAVEDWEDIAAGPGPEPGRRYLYIGDIGDNGSARASISVYRFPEPQLGRQGSGTPTEPAETIVLRYPDGPHDAETLLIHPSSGDLFIITKETISGVYRVRAPFEVAGPITMKKIARLSIFGNFADRTGGAFSPDGTRIALSTYGGWYEFSLEPRSRLTSADMEVIWARDPVTIGSAAGPQWEAIAYSLDGRSVFMTSEGIGTWLFSGTR